jgi:hypothetical protein
VPIHIVQQGEHLPELARKYGFTDFTVIWDLAENSQLNQDRHPNVLYPGDKIFIPDKQIRQDSGQTEKRHRFRLKGKPIKLWIRVQDQHAQPVAEAPCTVCVEREVQNTETNRKGLVGRKIKPTDKDGNFAVYAFGIDAPIRIGHMDPVGETSGYKARLNNLGYNAGPMDEEESAGLTERDKAERRIRLQMAIEQFQADNDLKVEGICNEETQARLKDAHGC